MTKSNEFLTLDDPTEVHAFLRQQMDQTGYTPASIARAIGAPHYRVNLRIFRSGRRITCSKYFEPLCDFLRISWAQRADIRLVDQGQKARDGP